MSKLKIIALAALTVSCNIATFAYNTHSCSTQIRIPCEKHKWRVGAAALYLQPNFGGNNLGYSSFSNYGTDFFNNQIEVNGAPNNLNILVPNRGWGYQFEAAYEFGSRNDVNINWYHLYENNNGRFSTGTLFAGSASALYGGKFNIKPRWDAINVEFGQKFSFNPENDFRLHVGLDFSNIQTTFTNYPQLTSTGSPLFITTDRITYTGVGPRLGGDYTYNSCLGFGAYAKVAGSLLVGTAKQSVSGYRDLTGFNLYSTGNYNQSNNGVVVPELEANLGLKYDLKLKEGTFSIDAGYLFVTYLNALVSQVGAGVVSSSISTSSSANFNLNGPHIGVSWTGNF